MSQTEENKRQIQSGLSVNVPHQRISWKYRSNLLYMSFVTKRFALFGEISRVISNLKEFSTEARPY